MHARNLLSCLSILALAWGCSPDSGGDGAADTPGMGFDTLPFDAAADDAGPRGDRVEDLPPVEDASLQDGTQDGLVPVDVVLTDFGPEGPPTETSSPEDTPQDTGPAGDLAPCLEDTDCLSGLCGWHFGDLVCLPPADGVCPPALGADEVQLDPGDPGTAMMCVSLYSHLCLPCWSDADCQDELTDNHACVKLGVIGGFCATVSPVPGADPSCPEGYIVSNTLKKVGADPAGPHGGIVSGCVPPIGTCACTDTASALGLNTFCFSGSDALGWCTGERTCTPDGMSACSVGPPSDEVCDGLDNDCDGETDEGLCVDENPCTEDLCNPETGCAFEPLTGTPCDDQDACTDDLCQAGACVGTPIEFPDPGPCAEVVCDPITGDQVVFVPGACDDGDICTTNDQCVAGACVGSFDPPGPPPEEACMGWTCDGGGGWWVAPLTGDPCEDGDPCTAGDSCDAGVCVSGGPDPCDDANTCTADSCEPGVGCAHAPAPDCCGNGAQEAGEECDDGNQADGDGCDAACVSEGPCLDDWLVGSPCNDVDYGNGCVPADTGYHFKGIYDGYACWWHHKNQAWNTTQEMNYYHLAQHFGLDPSSGKVSWCHDKSATPTPLSYSISGYFDVNNVGAWGWCAESDPNSVGFVCLLQGGLPPCP